MTNSDKEISDERWKELNDSRSDSRLWTIVCANPNFDRQEKDRLYTKAFCLINLAYMLVEVQDWCLHDFDDIIKKCGIHTKHESKKAFSKINNAIKTAYYNTGELGNDKGHGTETETYINGNADIFYDVCRMLIDRLAETDDVKQVISLLRDIPNRNHVFPELDEGEYIVDF